MPNLVLNILNRLGYEAHEDDVAAVNWQEWNDQKTEDSHRENRGEIELEAKPKVKEPAMEVSTSAGWMDQGGQFFPLDGSAYTHSAAARVHHNSSYEKLLDEGWTRVDEGGVEVRDVSKISDAQWTEIENLLMTRGEIIVNAGRIVIPVEVSDLTDAGMNLQEYVKSWKGLASTVGSKKQAMVDAWLAKKANDPVKKTVGVNGIKIKIEWPIGSTRTYENDTITTKMKADYGYLPKSEGDDGEEIDVYIGPNHESKKVFKIQQLKKGTQEPDEEKFMLGYDSSEEAKKSYQDHMPPEFFGSISEMTWDQFAKMVRQEQKKTADDQVKKVIDMHGIQFDIEWPKGSVREQDDNIMIGDYGFVPALVDKDGDSLDVLIGPDHKSLKVFKVEQLDKDDEKRQDKYILGTGSEKEAVALYDRHFADKRRGTTSEMPWSQFVSMIQKQQNKEASYFLTKVASQLTAIAGSFDKPRYVSAHGLSGKLIVLEGLDGSGKSTNLQMLKQALELEGHKVVVTAWNSSKLVSDLVKEAKKNKLLTPVSFSLLHATDLAERMKDTIIPALKKGSIVLADRYFPTAFARDSVRGMDSAWLRNVYAFAIKPDAIVYLDLPVKEAVDRVLARKASVDSVDKSVETSDELSMSEDYQVQDFRVGNPKYYEGGLDLKLSDDPIKNFHQFQEKVSEKYAAMSEEFGFTKVQANQDKVAVHKAIMAAVLPVVGQVKKAFLNKEATVIERIIDGVKTKLTVQPVYGLESENVESYNVYDESGVKLMTVPNPTGSLLSAVELDSLVYEELGKMKGQASMTSTAEKCLSCGEEFEPDTTLEKAHTDPLYGEKDVHVPRNCPKCRAKFLKELKSNGPKESAQRLSGKDIQSKLDLEIRRKALSGKTKIGTIARGSSSADYIDCSSAERPAPMRTSTLVQGRYDMSGNAFEIKAGSGEWQMSHSVEGAKSLVARAGDYNSASDFVQALMDNVGGYHEAVLEKIADLAHNFTDDQISMMASTLQASGWGKETALYEVRQLMTVGMDEWMIGKDKDMVMDMKEALEKMESRTTASEPSPTIYEEQGSVGDGKPGSLKTPTMPNIEAFHMPSDTLSQQPKACPDCKGTGKRTAPWDLGDASGELCSLCEGTGEMPSEARYRTEGSEKETYYFSFVAGVGGMAGTAQVTLNPDEVPADAYEVIPFTDRGDAAQKLIDYQAQGHTTKWNVPPPTTKMAKLAKRIDHLHTYLGDGLFYCEGQNVSFEASLALQKDDEGNTIYACPFDKAPLPKREVLDGTYKKEGAEEDIVEDEGPTEEDIMIQDVGHLGSGTAAFQNGKQIAKMSGDNYDSFYEDIASWMRKQNFYPGVWYVNDHGNVDLDSGWIDYTKSHKVF